MIEVNLLPGGKKRSSGRGFSLSRPSFGGGGGGGLPTDPYILGAVAAGILSLGLMAWLFMGVSGDREEVQVALDSAIQDSLRFADIIERTTQLTARRDSIAQRVAIIQEIDADRYVWPHVLDEVARALPDFMWLREMTYLGADPLQVRISGQAGSTFAITNFMRQLEASSFFRGVNLERNEQATLDGGNAQDVVYQFDLTVTYVAPPIELLETVPLLDNVSTQMAVPDTVEG